MMAGFMSSEELMVIVVPVAVYWLYSGFYELFGKTKAMEKYRLHSRREEETQNLASRKDVIRVVLQQQALQAAISLAALKLAATQDGNEGDAGAGERTLAGEAARFVVGMLVFDAWQYFMHRCMHGVPYLYRRFHSWHHRIAAPYAFAAQYLHPVDSVLTDTLSGAAALLASGMSPRAMAAFVVLVTVKGIDDHCGVLVPWNPLHAAFGNNTAYHDAHHQLAGGKGNFAQPFFTLWDRLLGTHAPYAVQERKAGGLEVKIIKQKM